MPYDLGGTITGKPPKGKQRISLRVRSHTEGDIQPLGDGGSRDLDGEGSLPPVFRTRLHELFTQIEKEFEHMYAENLALQDRLDGLSERREKDRDTLPETPDAFDCSSKPVAKPKGTNVQKIKPAQKLKVQTSKFVSSFKAPTMSSSFIREYQGHKDGVWDVAVSHTQPVIGTASADHTARLWNLESSQCLGQYSGHSGSVNSIRFHPSQDLILTASGDYTAHVWKPPISTDQQRTHSSEEEVEGPERDRDESVEDVICSRIRGPLMELRGHGGVVIAADWLVGGDQVITASWDRSANLWDSQTGEIMHNLIGHDQELSHCCAHPSQKLAVTASKDTTFRLWDFREAIHSVSVFQGHTDTVTSVVFTRGEEKVLSGSDDRTVKLWDLRNMRSPLDNVQCDSQVNRLAVSPASRTLAIPLDNRHVRLYDLQQHRLARLPRSNRQGHRRMVCAAAWTNDGHSSRANLFTCGFDRLLLGWNVGNPKDHKE